MAPKPSIGRLLGAGDGMSGRPVRAGPTEQVLEYRADAATVVPAAAQADNVSASSAVRIFSESIAPMSGDRHAHWSVPCKPHRSSRISPFR